MSDLVSKFFCQMHLAENQLQRSGAGKTLRGHDARYLEKTVGCRSCKPAGIDERMKYFEQRGSLKAGKIEKKSQKGGYSEHQNADGC